MKVSRLMEFENWISNQNARTIALIEARIFRLESYDYFGDSRYLGGGLAELKWTNGLRICFIRAGKREVLILIGGFKHDQKEDIRRARVLISRIASI